MISFSAYDFSTMTALLQKRNIMSTTAANYLDNIKLKN